MLAVILAGGLGTRLRPLTLTRPKPIVPVLNVPFLRYQLAWLHQHAVRQAVLACSYGVEAIREVIGDGRSLGMLLSYAVEPEPLGTAGALRNAADVGDGLVAVLNGDILTDLDLTAMSEFHRGRGSRATIYLTSVDDPTRYGLVETDAHGQILRFLEKPSPEQVTVNTINGGVYILERGLLESIPKGIPFSMEREFFPALLAHRIPFFGHAGRAYWIDIGAPDRYRQVQADLMAGKVATPIEPSGTRAGDLWIDQESIVSAEASLTGPAVIGRRSRLGPGCRVGPFTVLGDGATLEEGSSVVRAVLWQDVHVGPGARLIDCVIADGCRIGASAEIGPGTVLGAESIVPAGARVGP